MQRKVTLMKKNLYLEEIKSMHSKGKEHIMELDRSNHWKKWKVKVK